MEGAENPDGSFNEWEFSDPRRGPDVGPVPKLQDACFEIDATAQDTCEAGPGLSEFPTLQAALSPAPDQYRTAARHCYSAVQRYMAGYGYQGDIQLRRVARIIDNTSAALQGALR